MINPGDPDTLAHSSEETNRLDEIGRLALKRDLLDSYVKVQGIRDSLYLRGFMLDAHGTVIAIVSAGPGSPFCRPVHFSRIMELNPIYRREDEDGG